MSKITEEIRRLDPEKDHQRIVFLITTYEFPFDITRALDYALFRTFCSPSISSILYSTGEVHGYSQKRYDDTNIIVSEIFEHGYDSPRGKQAIRRMNQLHNYYSIPNDDYLYVLSTFIYEPIRWITRFGWRPLTRREKLAIFYFWRQVARRMNIKDVPATYEQLEKFNREYEQRNFRYSPTNQRVAEATRDMFLNWFPAPLRPISKLGLYAMLDETLLTAFGFPRMPKIAGLIVEYGLRLRGRAASLIPRRKPRLRTQLKHRSYPQGYRIEQLGPGQPTSSSKYLRPRRQHQPVAAPTRVEVGAELE